MAKRGRKKGSTCFVDLTYEELGEYVGRRGVVKVSKVWLESLGCDGSMPIPVKSSLTPAQDESKIQFTLTDLNE